MRTSVTCEKVRAELVHRVVAGQSSSGWAEIDAHLSGCPACAGEHARIQHTWDLQVLWDDVDVPAEALAPVHAAIQAARRPSFTRLQGIADGVLASLILWVIGHLVPLSTLCATCHSALRATPLGQYGFLDEFIVGTLLAIPSLVVVILLNRISGRTALPGRLWSMGLTYSLLAGVGGPLVRFIVAPGPNTVAWAAGCLMGGSMTVALGQLRIARAAPR